MSETLALAPAQGIHLPVIHEVWTWLVNVNWLPVLGIGALVAVGIGATRWALKKAF